LKVCQLHPSPFPPASSLFPAAPSLQTWCP
jgi:hypothetical protein